MEEEYVRYRKASIKGKLLIAKKFSKFYLNDFTPLTRLEEADIQRSQNLYRASIIMGAISFGFISYKLRSIRYASMEAHEAPRDFNAPMNILNSALMGVLGFFGGHLFGCDYIYKNR